MREICPQVIKVAKVCALFMWTICSSIVLLPPVFCVFRVWVYGFYLSNMDGGQKSLPWQYLNWWHIPSLKPNLGQIAISEYFNFQVLGLLVFNTFKTTRRCQLGYFHQHQSSHLQLMLLLSGPEPTLVVKKGVFVFMVIYAFNARLFNPIMLWPMQYSLAKL